MKKNAARRLVAAGMAAALVSQGTVLPAAAQNDSVDMPDPVFALDFDDLSQSPGDAVSGAIAAATGETVTVNGNVTAAEGYGADGKAVFLDNTAGNTGWLSTPNTDKLNPEDITVSVWLKRTEETSSKEGRILWNKETTATNGNCWMADGWFVGWTPGEAMAFVTDGQNMAKQNGGSDEILPLNEWINIVSTFDSATGEMVIYLNGSVYAESTVSGASITKNNNAAEMLIGKSGYGNEGLGCVVDDIRIYSQALTQEQVGQLAGLNDQGYADADAGDLNIASRVTGDFTLPVTGNRGSAISWESDNAAIQIGENGAAAVTRGSEDTTVKLTATVTYGTATATQTFDVTVVKENQPVEGLQKLSYDEIIDVGGTVGTRLKDAVDNYAMDYLYGQMMDSYLREYENHSHSGWSWLEGEQPGKWLESMANAKWMDEDGSIEAAITDVVDRLAATQTTEDRSAAGYNQFAGYLGNATESIRNSKPVKGMDPYEMYSTLNGLIRVYENYKEDNTELADKSLDCAVKLADYLVATIGDEDTYVPYQDGTLSTMHKTEFWPLAITNGTTIAGHDVHQGWEGTLLIDPMMNLSEVVKDVSGQEDKSQVYSDWVDWAIANIDKWASSYGGYGDTPYEDLDKVASGEMGIDEIQHYVHAHTFQMNFLGFLKKYQETGDSSYLDKVVGAWEDISSRQKYITGTVSVGEHYEAGHNLPNTGNVGETCATNSWTLLNNNLFELTGDAAYQQTVEDVIFNHMFATSTIDGDGYSYHRPLNGTTDRFFTGPDCCSSSGMRMQSYVPYYIYSKSDSEVYVNQFIESEVNITLENGNTIHLKQTTDYPETDEIVLEVTDVSADTVLNIRIPDWVKEPSIKINGNAVEGISADSYAAVTVSKGDIVEITYPSELTWVKGDNSNDGLWAMKKGPMVYALAAAFMTEEESQAAYGADIASATATSVITPEDGQAVQTEGEVDFGDERIFGKGYRVLMTTAKGEQEVTVVPYANIGQWYRIGEARPSDYNSADRYPYAIWLSAILSDYPVAPEEQSTPVVHYDFDTVEGTTLKDISGNGHDAVLEGGVTISDDGVLDDGTLGKSAQFNGTDGYVQMPDDVIYGLHNMTISTWVKPDTLGSWARIFDFGSESDPPYPNFFLTVDSGNDNLRLAFEAGSSSADKSLLDAGAVLQTGQWQHLAVVIDGTKATLYLNGEEIAQASDYQFVPMLITNMTSNMLGRSNYTADSYFDGSMDDFRIYNRALSAAEITMLSNGEEPVREIQTVSDPEDVETTAGVAPVLPEKANVTYADGTNGTEPIVWEDIPEENYAQAGTFTVKGTVGTFEVEITVTVKAEEEPEEPELTGIQVTEEPENKVYQIGDELDLTGLKVEAFYSDGMTQDVTSDAEISGFDSETAGEKTVTVSYGGKETYFTVTVEEKSDPSEPEEPELTELQVTAPEKTVYEIGDELDLTGLKVTAIYSDGTTQDVTSDVEISGFDSETAGEKIITVSYGELDTSFTVTVEEKEDPTDPSDPSDPTDPSDPADPSDPGDPTDPTGPEDPSLPSDGGQGDGAGTVNPEEQTAVQTGDSLSLTPYLAALILAGTVSGIILIRKKRSEN